MFNTILIYYYLYFFIFAAIVIQLKQTVDEAYFNCKHSVFPLSYSDVR